MTRSWSSLQIVLGTGSIAGLAALGSAGGGGSIDTDGAILEPGAAPVPGEVVLSDGSDLGAPPEIGNWYGQFPGNAPSGIEYAPPQLEPGLGGPDFRARADITLPGGVYDFGNFVVDPLVRVTFEGPTTVRVAKDAVVEGQVEMTGAARGDVFAFRCAGFLRVEATAGAPCGFAADDDGASILLDVRGDVTVTAEDGGEPKFSAAGTDGRIRILALRQDQSLTRIDCERTEFTAGGTTSLDAWGPVTLVDCTAVGRLSVQCREPILYDCDEDDCRDADADEDAAIVRGGTYDGGLSIYARSGDVSLLDGVTVTGPQCDLFASGYGGGPVSGHVVLGAGTTIEVTDHVTFAATESLDIGDGSLVRTTSGRNGSWLFLGARGEVLVREDVRIEHAGDAGPNVGQVHDSLAILGDTVTVRGSVRGAGPETYLGANADVVLEGDAVLDGGDGAVVLGAHGAVVAEGGSVVIRGAGVDIRCATGDLDLDLSEMTASEGRFAALANGRVRLRGTYSAARDIQVISLADVVSVAGATLRTADVSDGLSGFVRLATYGSPTTLILGGDVSSDGDDEDEDEDEDDGEDAKMRRADDADARTLINAAGSTLRTGASDAQSGSILLENQEGSGRVAKASLRVARATARVRGDEVVTQIRGTLVVPRPRLDLTGSGRVTAGTVEERVLVTGRKGTLRGAGRAVRLRLGRASSRRIAVAIEVREPTADHGRTARVGFHRAGLHVQGRFRRPRLRTR